MLVSFSYDSIERGKYYLHLKLILTENTTVNHRYRFYEIFTRSISTL